MDGQESCNNGLRCASGLQRTDSEEKDGGSWVRMNKSIPVPDSILDYNQRVGVADLSDALIGYYSETMK